MRTSARTQHFPESVIREMTRIALGIGAINLAQGYPDFGAPEALKQAAAQAIAEDWNQYSVTWGIRPLREAIAETYRRRYEIDADPDRNIVVCCGATEGMIASMLGTLDPGDEVILFEPFYENYIPDMHMCGATPRFITLRPPSDRSGQPNVWWFDPDELRAAFNSRTRAIIVNSPHNPTGHVFTREQLQHIAGLCIEHDALVFTDEIYEHITYEGAQHIPIASLPGMAERTVTISGMSKTFSITGWRLGFVIAPADLMSGIRKAHDFLTVCAATPLQAAALTALKLGDDYYAQLKRDYTHRRDLLFKVLRDTGFRPFVPRGAYYIMADYGDLSDMDDMAFGMYLAREVGVAAVPGSSFYFNRTPARKHIRFTFCKKDETLLAAAEKLKQWRAVAR